MTGGSPNGVASLGYVCLQWVCAFLSGLIWSAFWSLAMSLFE